MLWEVEIEAKEMDAELARVADEFRMLTHRSAPESLLGSARGYLLEGDLDEDEVTRFAAESLGDPVIENWVCNPLPLTRDGEPGALHWTVLLKPGVMDPVADSVKNVARGLGLSVDAVRTFRRYVFDLPGP